MVAEMPGLAAFWSFGGAEGADVVSRHDPRLDMNSLPFLLGHVGDDARYAISAWPYAESAAQLRYASGGPFGRAIHLDQGHIYGIVPRELFDKTFVDVGGRRPFTMIAWLRFTGERHLIGGIWDEGCWSRYGGRRQAALFAGLFDQPGVIAHVSATGAACYPQSHAEGSQFARTRAIDGAPIETGVWLSAAITFDPVSETVAAYKDGVATPAWLTDPVMDDVLRVGPDMLANPITMSDNIFKPDALQLKFSGFDYVIGPVAEHLLDVDFAEGLISYRQVAQYLVPDYRVRVSLESSGEPDLELNLQKSHASFPPGLGSVEAVLEFKAGTEWRQAAEPLQYTVQEGAPFTFGRAIGVGEHGAEFGSQIDLAGFAIFNRVLESPELYSVAFPDPPESAT